MSKNVWLEVIGDTMIAVGSAIIATVVTTIMIEARPPAPPAYKDVAETYKDLLEDSYKRNDELKEEIKELKKGE